MAEQLADFEKSQSGLHQLLSAIVARLHVLEEGQAKANEKQTFDVSLLKTDIEKNVLGLKRIDNRLTPLELEMENVIFQIQGYTAKSAVTLSKLKNEELEQKPMRKKKKKVKANAVVSNLQQGSASEEGEHAVSAPTLVVIVDDNAPKEQKPPLKPCMIRLRKAVHKVILMNKINGSFKIHKGGIENTRLFPTMNIRDRLNRMDDFIFEIHAKLTSHSSDIQQHYDDIKTKANLVDHRKVADNVNAQGNKLTEQAKSISTIKGDLSMEVSDRTKGDKTIKDYLTNNVETKLDQVEKKVWENVDAMTKVEAHIIKTENRVSDNTENIASIMEELSKPPPVVDTKNGDHTDWSMLMEYSKQLHSCINKADGEAKGAAIKSGLEKCFKLTSSCIELARASKDDVEKEKSPESRKLTKNLETLAWNVNLLLKTDEEKQVTKELADWIPLLDFHVQEKANLHAFLVEILTFVQDAARARVDTIDLYIQAKQIQINIDGINDLNLKQDGEIKKLKSGMKEKAKTTSLQEHVDLTSTKLEELMFAIKSITESSKDSKKGDEEAIVAMKDEVQRTMNTTAFTLKTVKEELKQKASIEEVATIQATVVETQKQLATEIPKLQKGINSKAGEENLISLKSEFLNIVDGLSAELKDSNTTMLGGRTYCLSCQQPIKTPGPESDINIHTYYDGPLFNKSLDPISVPRPSSGVNSRSLPSVTKSAFPPNSSTSWNPVVNSPAPSSSHSGGGGNNKNDDQPKVQLPGMAKSKSSPGISSADDSEKVVISQYGNKMPVVTITDKSGNKVTKSFGSQGLQVPSSRKQ